MKPSEVLRKAKATIDTPEKWTQGAMAKNKEGRYCDVNGADAVCWCSDGAIYKASSPDQHLYNDTTPFIKKIVGESHVSWNDRWSRDHNEVMVAFDKAIDLAESQGA